MKIKNKTIICKSTPDNYEKEKSGNKNNTIRIFKTVDELLEYAEIIRLKDELKQIEIVNTETKGCFGRDLSDITPFEKDGLLMIIFSWKGFICKECDNIIIYNKCAECANKNLKR